MTNRLARDFSNVNLSGRSSGDQVSAGKINGFELKVAPKSTVFRYDVEIIKINERKQKILTNQSDPSVRTVQREACSDIIEALFMITGGFGVECKYVYDGKKTLFTSKQINLKQSTNSLEAKQLKSRAALFLRGDRVDITVTPNQEYHRLDYSNLRDCLVGDVREQADRSARMFFEMVTSQQLINDDKYQMVSAGTLFEKQATDLKDNRGQPISGMSMRVGFKKGARVTEHTEPKAFIFLDLKRTAFFSTELMSELYKKMVRGNNREFERFFKGVRMQVVYDPSRTFLFGSLSQKNISDAAYKVNGQSIPDFMRAKKNITVALTNAPGVHPDQPNGRSILYPLEAIRPLEGQLVPLEKQSGFAIRALLMENSILPQDRFNYCNQQFLTISTGEGAKFLAQFGLSFVPNSNTIKVCANPMPKMAVGDKKVIQPKPNGSWNDEIVTAKLLKPTTKLKKWYVAFDQTVLNINFATNYIRSLMTEAEKSGIALPEPIEFVPTDMFKLEEVFKKALANKVQFIFYIDSQQKKSHSILKLFEAYYKILSQQIVDKNLRNGPQTLKNVLLKLNVKAFGLNYTPSPSPLLNGLRLECEDLLVIGYDIAPPEKLDAKGFADYCRRHKLNPSEKKIRSLHPAAVGVCGNKGLDPYAFTGDIFYQEANGGLVDPEMLSKAVENIVAEASKHRKNLARLIVFRDGVSEGEQSQVVIHELPAVRQGFAKGLARTQQNANIAVKVTFIVATKMHNKRFFRADGQKISNTRAGDSIRSDALRSDIKELYVQAHHPLKGMPRVPSFDVLVDEIKIPDQKLEHFIIHLSNMHQVSACPTSLPLPVFLADETAKRAEEIYKALLHYRGTREGERFGQELTRIKEIYDPNVLTAKLQYVGHPLYGTRFNA